MSDTNRSTIDQPKRLIRSSRPPKQRNCKIYEQHIVEGQTQEQVAAAFGITQQRVGQIAARVEAWIATHADHPLAQGMRHTRELALSGIEKVYFAVIGRGFRQEDLDKLAGFMAGTPIRGIVFIEAAALMRLVSESIQKRREFRLADFDRLLFGNKIIE